MHKFTSRKLGRVIRDVGLVINNENFLQSFFCKFFATLFLRVVLGFLHISEISFLYAQWCLVYGLWYLKGWGIHFQLPGCTSYGYARMIGESLSHLAHFWGGRFPGGAAWNFFKFHLTSFLISSNNCTNSGLCSAVKGEVVLRLLLVPVRYIFVVVNNATSKYFTFTTSHFVVWCQNVPKFLPLVIQVFLRLVASISTRFFRGMLIQM